MDKFLLPKTLLENLKKYYCRWSRVRNEKLGEMKLETQTGHINQGILDTVKSLHLDQCDLGTLWVQSNNAVHQHLSLKDLLINSVLTPNHMLENKTKQLHESLSLSLISYWAPNALLDAHILFLLIKNKQTHVSLEPTCIPYFSEKTNIHPIIKDRNLDYSSIS